MVNKPSEKKRSAENKLSKPKQLLELPEDQFIPLPTAKGAKKVRSNSFDRPRSRREVFAMLRAPIIAGFLKIVMTREKIEARVNAEPIAKKLYARLYSEYKALIARWPECKPDERLGIPLSLLEKVYQDYYDPQRHYGIFVEESAPRFEKATPDMSIPLIQEAAAELKSWCLSKCKSDRRYLVWRHCPIEAEHSCCEAYREMKRMGYNITQLTFRQDLCKARRHVAAYLIRRIREITGSDNLDVNLSFCEDHDIYQYVNLLHGE